MFAFMHVYMYVFIYVCVDEISDFRSETSQRI
jgi:hypothetical protein